MGFKSLVLSRRELDALGVERASELLARQVALPEQVVVLEELEQSDSVALHHLFDLGNQG